MITKYGIQLRILLVWCIYSTGFAQTSIPEKMMEKNKTRILIAKGDSGLEYNVVEIIKKHFEDKGYTVHLIPIKKVRRQDLENYKVFLLLSALEKNRVLPYIQKAITKIENLNENDRPRLYISSVAGENWVDKSAKIDVVTGASEPGNVKDIALKIINRLENLVMSK